MNAQEGSKVLADQEHFGVSQAAEALRARPRPGENGRMQEGGRVRHGGVGLHLFRGIPRRAAVA